MVSMVTRLLLMLRGLIGYSTSLFNNIKYYQYTYCRWSNGFCIYFSFQELESLNYELSTGLWLYRRSRCTLCVQVLIQPFLLLPLPLPSYDIYVRLTPVFRLNWLCWTVPAKCATSVVH